MSEIFDLKVRQGNKVLSLESQNDMKSLKQVTLVFIQYTLPFINIGNY